MPVAGPLEPSVIPGSRSAERSLLTERLWFQVPPPELSACRQASTAVAPPLPSPTARRDHPRPRVGSSVVRPGSARTAHRSVAPRRSRPGTVRPHPAQATRWAFSAMSPTDGEITSGTPAPSARATVPWPPWQTTTCAERHQLRVGEPGDEEPVVGHVDRLSAAHGRSSSPRPAPARPPAPRSTAGSGRTPGPAPCWRRRARSGPRLRASRCRDAAARTPAARPPRPPAATAAGTRAGGTSRRSPAPH